jgi:hypothetical protein
MTVLTLSNHWQSRTCQIYIFIDSLYKKRPHLKSVKVHFCQNDLFKSLSLKDYFLTLSICQACQGSGCHSDFISKSPLPSVPTLYKSLPYAKGQGQPHVKVKKSMCQQTGYVTPLPPLPKVWVSPDLYIEVALPMEGGREAWLLSPVAKRTFKSLTAVPTLYKSLPTLYRRVPSLMSLSYPAKCQSQKVNLPKVRGCHASLPPLRYGCHPTFISKSPLTLRGREGGRGIKSPLTKGHSCH